MPALNEIAILINTALKTGHFKAQRFNPTRFNALADPIRKTDKEGKETTTPNIISDNGEATELVFNDKFSAQGYHRLISPSYDLADPAYGKPGKDMAEIANMKFVFMGNRAKMKVRQEDVIAAVAFDFPKEFSAAQYQPLGLTSCIIEMGAVEENPYDVFVSEWDNHEYALTTSSILFAMNYKIISTYNKCFQICS